MRAITQIIEQEIYACATTLILELFHLELYDSDYYDDLLSLSEKTERIYLPAYYRDEYTNTVYLVSVGDNNELVYSALPNNVLHGEQNLIDKGEYPEYLEKTYEIYEYYIISDWLADKLQNYDEVVVKDFLGFNIWGRTITGQAIHCDYVFQRIYNDLNKNNSQ
jgi:hypothetical protein